MKESFNSIRTKYGHGSHITIKILKKIRKLGVIKRVNDKIDKRKVIIKLTKLGLNREIAKKTVLNFNNKIFSEINEQEKEVFFAVLNKINKLINNIK